MSSTDKGRTAPNAQRRIAKPLTAKTKATPPPVESIELELFGPAASTEATAAVRAGVPSMSSKSSSSSSPPPLGKTKGQTRTAMQKLAKSFVSLNKRKAEKRDREQSTWKSLIQNALDLQKGKIPLLLAVEAGNQSMCRELLSSQTVDQLKVSTSSSVCLRFFSGVLNVYTKSCWQAKHACIHYDVRIVHTSPHHLQL